MVLNPALWKPRFTVVYNQQERAAFTLRWMLTSRLTRIDCIPLRAIKDTWNKGGDLDRLSDGVKVGRTRYIPWGSSYQVWPNDNFYPFNLKWKPVPWFPQGRVQFWEYTGTISDSDLLDYMQLDDSNPNADLAIQIETLRQQMLIVNPSGATTKQKITDFLPINNIQREMVPANLERNGGTIFNKTSKALYVGFGADTDKNGPNKVLPGGQMEIQGGFVGAINGLFDGADTNPAAKAIVEEMVA